MELILPLLSYLSRINLLESLLGCRNGAVQVWLDEFPVTSPANILEDGAR